MSADQRRDLVNKLRDGDIRVLTSCDIISEGFDAPAVGGAILLRPTQSLALFRQQVGRCLRPKPDGSAAVIVITSAMCPAMACLMRRMNGLWIREAHTGGTAPAGSGPVVEIAMLATRYF